MKKLKLIAISMIMLLSCNEDHLKENIEQLKADLHGKYEVISSYSQDPVDINMDGISSTNLLDENPEISKASLEIRIWDNSGHLFEEKWPVESIAIPKGETFDSTSYHPTYSIYYALYINPSLCEFIDDDKSIRLIEHIQNNSTNTLIDIESIKVEEYEVITVKTIRKLYTRNGWITTKIESKYKRYTTIT